MNVMFYVKICIVSFLLFLANMATSLQLLLRNFCFMIQQLSSRKSFENGTNFHMLSNLQLKISFKVAISGGQGMWQGTPKNGGVLGNNTN